MKNCLLVFAFFLAFLPQGEAQLSEKAEISLLTCTPGNEIYSTFGHSAIRVKDVRDGAIVDSVYNWGTFSFNQPNFVLKFARGKLNYSLSRQFFPRFQAEYIYEGRGIQEQILDLDSLQKQQLYAALLENYQPQNRDYKYDFFFDNCSTRIRDIIENETGQVSYPDTEGTYTFRELIQLYLNDMPWSDFGIDLALGLPCDRMATEREEMFLPDFLHDAAAVAMLDGAPLMENDQMLLGVEEFEDNNLPISPMQTGFIYLGLSVLLLLLGFKKVVFHQLALRIHLLIGGLLGLMLILLWFATDHTITAQNLNLLWAWPVHLIVLASTFRKGWQRMYLWGFFLLQLVVLAFWNLWPQDFHEAFIPFIVAHLLSAGAHLWRGKRN